MSSADMQAAIDALTAQTAALEAAVEDQNAAVYGIFLLLNAINVCWMQAGFATLELGSVRQKHAKSILFKNLADMGIATIAWYLIGFAIAGDGASGAVGKDFALQDTGNYLAWVHSFSFVTTAATIISGAVAERMTLPAYLFNSVVVVGITYASIVNLCWSGDGWLVKQGMVDFAGSGVVHTTGGVAALVACILVGPRLLRFKTLEDETTGRPVIVVNEFKGHNAAMSNIGIWILYCGWISFNASSVLDTSASGIEIAGRAAVNTILSGGSSMSTSFLHNGMKRGTCDLPAAHNALLAGLVGVTGGCAYMEPVGAIATGITAYAVYIAMSNFILARKIDDPLDAFPVHGVCGMWGLICVGLFAKGELLETHFGYPHHPTNHQGIFYGGSGSLLGAQLLGAVVISGIVAAQVFVVLMMFKMIKTEKGGTWLRVDTDTEVLGLDFKYHEGSIYPRMETQDIELHNMQEHAARRARSASVFKKNDKKKFVQRRMQSRLENLLFAQAPIYGEHAGTQSLSNELGDESAAAAAAIIANYEAKGGAPITEKEKRIFTRMISAASEDGQPAEEAKGGDPITEKEKRIFTRMISAASEDGQPAEEAKGGDPITEKEKRIFDSMTSAASEMDETDEVTFFNSSSPTSAEAREKSVEHTEHERYQDASSEQGEA
mmetsp:Transcript_15757/g.48042  ORF Transcript_15757/g.48042 Transcript_15757/m.48042 type:complete len:664 (-) Transcript_15757:98-2089(-)